MSFLNGLPRTLADCSCSRIHPDFEGVYFSIASDEVVESHQDSWFLISLSLKTHCHTTELLILEVLQYIVSKELQPFSMLFLRLLSRSLDR
jgi:hypothetical protein